MVPCFIIRNKLPNRFFWWKIEDKVSIHFNNIAYIYIKKYIGSTNNLSIHFKKYQMDYIKMLHYFITGFNFKMFILTKLNKITYVVFI